MLRRHITSLLLCLALLTQSVAIVRHVEPLDMRAGYVACDLHASSKAIVDGDQDSGGAPKTARHDCATCLLCQAALLAPPSIFVNDLPQVPTESRSISISPRANNVARLSFNPGAPARAPPFNV